MPGRKMIIEAVRHLRRPARAIHGDRPGDLGQSPIRGRREQGGGPRFAREVDPHSIQVSVAAPYPGTELYRQARERGWLPEDDEGATLVSADGNQVAALSYPHLGHTEILDSVDAFYRRFYFRAGKLAEMSAELFRHPEMTGRRLREGAEFARFLSRRARTPEAQA